MGCAPPARFPPKSAPPLKSHLLYLYVYYNTMKHPNMGCQLQGFWCRRAGVLISGEVTFVIPVARRQLKIGVANHDFSFYVTHSV